MTYEKQSGSCIDGKRHKWGPSVRRGHLMRYHDEKCLNCNRVRVTQFTKRGNHIAGYYTATEK